MITSIATVLLNTLYICTLHIETVFAIDVNNNGSILFLYHRLWIYGSWEPESNWWLQNFPHTCCIFDPLHITIDRARKIHLYIQFQGSAIQLSKKEMKRNLSLILQSFCRSMRVFAILFCFFYPFKRRIYKKGPFHDLSKVHFISRLRNLILYTLFTIWTTHPPLNLFHFLIVMRLISLCLSLIIPAATAAECAGLGSVRKLLLTFHVFKLRLTRKISK